MSLFDDASEFFRTVQGEICEGLSDLDGVGEFREDTWQRPGGGGGASRIMERGAVIEKGGVNWSLVEGELPADVAAAMPGNGRAFRASGVSLVLHPRSPMVPTVHANFRMFEQGDTAWFGGGADLTPYYFFRDDAVSFHQAWHDVCARHAVADYNAWKAECDRYFYLPHRGETRGIGGLFFDYVGASQAASLPNMFAFMKDAARTFLPTYAAIVARRREAKWSDAERKWQLMRRGRYVEFNLLYDRGTVFGLKTGGRTESILMSMPPEVRWDYNHSPAPGSREAELVAHLTPTDWLGLGAAGASAGAIVGSKG